MYIDEQPCTKFYNRPKTKAVEGCTMCRVSFHLDKALYPFTLYGVLASVVIVSPYKENTPHQIIPKAKNKAAKAKKKGLDPEMRISFQESTMRE